jgi:hypothetical protein
MHRAKETKSEKTQKHTRVTAASVTFDADDDDDDETSILFQSVTILESDNEDTLDPGPENKSPASDDNTDTHTNESDNGTTHPTPSLAALQSSSIEPGTNYIKPYEWGNGTFYPHWGTMPPPLNEDPSWGGAYTRRDRQERNELRQRRSKVFEQGGSPPPKIEQKTNLLVDKNEQHTPHSNTQASDDLAFWTGPRKEGIVQKRRNQAVHTHPNPFEKLDEEKEDNAQDVNAEMTSIPNTSVQPKTQRSTKKKKQRVTPNKEDDRSDRDLSMCQLSEDESDYSLTIYYKAYNKDTPEMN